MERLETEIKLRAGTPREIAARLRSLKATLHRKRLFEDNYLFDDRQGRLHRAGSVLRVRFTGGTTVLTLKGRGRVIRRAKIRPEVETAIGDGVALLEILQRLGFQVGFRYQKFRTTYRHRSLLITVDETPIGNYLEIEGSRRQIEVFARRLGYQPGDFVSRTYYDLFMEFREAHQLRAEHMVFGMEASR